MKINIKMTDEITMYGNLQPGDVFNYGDNNMAAIGLKTDDGSVVIQYCNGSNPFEQVYLSDNTPVKFRGRLTELGVNL